VFAPNVDEPIDNLGKLRDLYVLNPTSTDTPIQTGQLFTEASLDNFDSTTIIRQLNFLGLPISESSIFSDARFARFKRNISQFWYSKGTHTLQDFLSYCLNSKISVERLWTDDYVTFIPESAVPLGQRVYESSTGSYYPTTHVRVGFNPSTFGPVSIKSFIKFFYDVCNYDLVVQSVISEDYVPITEPSLTASRTGVGMAYVRVNEQLLSTYDASFVPWDTIYTGITPLTPDIPTGTAFYSMRAEDTFWLGDYTNSYKVVVDAGNNVIDEPIPTTPLTWDTLSLSWTSWGATSTWGGLQDYTQAPTVSWDTTPATWDEWTSTWTDGYSVALRYLGPLSWDTVPDTWDAYDSAITWDGPASGVSSDTWSSTPLTWSDWNAQTWGGGQRTWASLPSSWSGWVPETWSGAAYSVISYTHIVQDIGSSQPIFIRAASLALGSVLIEIRTSTDNVSWSTWGQAPAGRTMLRFLQVRWSVSGSDPLLRSASYSLYGGSITVPLMLDGSWSFDGSNTLDGTV